MEIKQVEKWTNTRSLEEQKIRKSLADAAEMVADGFEREADAAEAQIAIEAKKQWLNDNGFVVTGSSMTKDVFNKAAAEARSIRDRASEARKDATRAKAALTDTDLFLDQAVTYTEYLSTEHDLAIADYCGRFPVNKETASFPVEMYGYTDCAETVEVGGTAGYYDITDYIRRVKTDADDIIRIMDILKTSEMMYNDDKKTMTKALNAAHVKRIINTENKVALAMLTGAKEAVSIDPLSVQAAINNNLCGVAKRGAEIWTNSAGFAALDVEIDGVSLIRRNGNGDFIYKSKYVVREFPADILPDTENGSPVLIGDFKNIVRFAVLYDETAIKTAVFPAHIHHREVLEEIPILTTSSDKAYINGYIVTA